MKFETKRLPETADAVAPDGSEVRTLLRTRGGSVAHFRFARGQTSLAVKHASIDEVWYILSGSGSLWRRTARQEQIVAISGDICISIPVGTCFQIRADTHTELVVIGVSTPAWPGDDEAIPVDGIWQPTTGDRTPTKT